MWEKKLTKKEPTNSSKRRKTSDRETITEIISLKILIKI